MYTKVPYFNPWIIIETSVDVYLNLLSLKYVLCSNVQDNRLPGTQLPERRTRKALVGFASSITYLQFLLIRLQSLLDSLPAFIDSSSFMFYLIFFSDFTFSSINYGLVLMLSMSYYLFGHVSSCATLGITFYFWICFWLCIFGLNCCLFS